MEHCLETSSEELGWQRLTLPHAFLDWYVNWVSEQRCIGQTDLICFLNRFDVFLPLQELTTRHSAQMSRKTFRNRRKGGMGVTCTPLHAPAVRSERKYDP